MDVEKQSNFITSLVRCDRHRYYYRCSYRSRYSSSYYFRYRYSTAVSLWSSLELSFTLKLSILISLTLFNGDSIHKCDFDYCVVVSVGDFDYSVVVSLLVTIPVVAATETIVMSIDWVS